MSKLFPVNCEENTQKPYKLAKIGLDDRRMPVQLLWCKRHGTEHIETLSQMLQSWRNIAAGDQQALLNLQGILKKALVNIQADLEDCTAMEPKEDGEQVG